MVVPASIAAYDERTLMPRPVGTHRRFSRETPVAWARGAHAVHRNTVAALSGWQSAGTVARVASGSARSPGTVALVTGFGAFYDKGHIACHRLPIGGKGLHNLLPLLARHVEESLGLLRRWEQTEARLHRHCEGSRRANNITCAQEAIVFRHDHSAISRFNVEIKRNRKANDDELRARLKHGLKVNGDSAISLAEVHGEVFHDNTMLSSAPSAICTLDSRAGLHHPGECSMRHAEGHQQKSEATAPSARHRLRRNRSFELTMAAGSTRIRPPAVVWALRGRERATREHAHTTVVSTLMVAAMVVTGSAAPPPALASVVVRGQAQLVDGVRPTTDGALYITARPATPDNIPAAVLSGSRGRPPPVLAARVAPPLSFPLDFTLEEPRDLTVEGAKDPPQWWRGSQLVVAARLDADGIAATRGPEDLVGSGTTAQGGTPGNAVLRIDLRDRGLGGKLLTSRAASQPGKP